MADSSDPTQVIHHLVIDVALQAALQAVTAAIPFLGFPVIKTVFFFIATQFSELLYKEIAKIITFEIISLETEAQQKAYEEAAARLKTILTQPSTQTPEEQNAEIEQAKEEFKKKLANLIHLHPMS